MPSISAIEWKPSVKHFLSPDIPWRRPRIFNEREQRQAIVEVCQRYAENTISVAMPEFERTPWCTSQRVYWAKGADGGAEEAVEGLEKLVLT
jgi:hypothetical protein